MVIVEPGHFVGREERNIDGSEVDRAERCDVEREEFAELRGRSPAGDDQVFDAHAPVAGTVEAGFIGDEDACLETELARLRCTRGDVEGTFVDVEAAAHAVARAVSEVEALGPEGRACDGVELRARDACGNDGAALRTPPVRNPPAALSDTTPPSRYGTSKPVKSSLGSGAEGSIYSSRKGL